MLGSPILSGVIRSLWPRAADPTRRDREAVARIRELSAPLHKVRDRSLQERADELRTTVQAGTEPTDQSVLLPAFALVSEAARRILTIDLYEVQLLAGMTLARGAIAEMQTGEGKTFVATLPAFVHALTGKGVHVMTVNTYLAGRDYELLEPVFRLLGVSVGLLRDDASPAEIHAAYASDITYGPGYEFGFDYLRDQASLLIERTPKLGEGYRGLLRGEKKRGPQMRQRGHAMAIIDEADSVLLDEATTPLILSGSPAQPAKNAAVYVAAGKAIEQLVAEQDYVFDQSTRQIYLTPQGKLRVFDVGVTVPQRGLQRPWPAYVEQALRGKLLMRRDIDYVVNDDKIQIVDQQTGRIFADRSWRDGLQQAVEAKEGVTITEENKPLARITRQRYFGLYRQLCGMTGTARGSERELRDVYGLNVVVIPTHKPCIRKTLPPRFFADMTAKHHAIADEVVRLHQSRQPILVGTATIESSEALARALDERSVAYRLLNGKQDAEEAHIIARAGEAGAITIATNMAGRGTDIKLAGGVARLGGLHVIACEPQESTRVDRQLMGRAARQGDPGSCQLFVSADDALIKRFAPALARRMKHLADANGEIHADLSGDISRLQRKVELNHFHDRRRMFAHDDWLETVLRKLAKS